MGSETIVHKYWRVCVCCEAEVSDAELEQQSLKVRSP